MKLIAYLSIAIIGLYTSLAGAATPDPNTWTPTNCKWVGKGICAVTYTFTGPNPFATLYDKIDLALGKTTPAPPVTAVVNQTVADEPGCNKICVSLTGGAGQIGTVVR